MCDCTKIAVIEDGMERRMVCTRFRRMEQPMAWKRTVQLPTAMAEAWLVVWQGRMLVAVQPIYRDRTVLLPTV
jgi:hypothetical protein